MVLVIVELAPLSPDESVGDYTLMSGNQKAEDGRCALERQIGSKVHTGEKSSSSGRSLSIGKPSRFGPPERGMCRSSGNSGAPAGVDNPYTAARHTQSLPFNLTAECGALGDGRDPV